MTDLEIIEYYADLLILQYIGMPKAYDTVSYLASQAIMDQLPDEVMNAFDITTAIGVQLDVIGQYVGVIRTGYVEGVQLTLDDADFRTLIAFASLKNSAGSSLYDIQQLLTYFSGAVLVIDYANMRMSYLVSSVIGSINMVLLAIQQNLLPVPMAVQLASVIYAPVINTFFGFRTYDLAGYNNSPFNNYDTYNLTYPWLNYDNAIYI